MGSDGGNVTGWHEPQPGEVVMAARADVVPGEGVLEEGVLVRTGEGGCPGWVPMPTYTVRFRDGVESEFIMPDVRVYDGEAWRAPGPKDMPGSR